jgi:hypothetical protein
MSLLRLLTTGKSLVGLKESDTRYRVTRQRMLPRFGSAKNPFCATDASAPARAAAQSPSVAPAKQPAAWVGSLWRKLAGTFRSRKATPQRAWAGKLSSLLSRPGRKPGAFAMPPPTKRPVQVELSLDTVKVMCNDLRDADLEIVPAKSPAARGDLTPPLPGVAQAESGTAWGRLAGRVFRAGKT